MGEEGGGEGGGKEEERGGKIKGRGGESGREERKVEQDGKMKQSSYF